MRHADIRHNKDVFHVLGPIYTRKLFPGEQSKFQII